LRRRDFDLFIGSIETFYREAVVASKFIPHAARPKTRFDCGADRSAHEPGPHTDSGDSNCARVGDALTQDLGENCYDLILISNLAHHFTMSKTAV